MSKGAVASLFAVFAADDDDWCGDVTFDAADFVCVVANIHGAVPDIIGPGLRHCKYTISLLTFPFSYDVMLLMLSWLLFLLLLS